MPPGLIFATSSSLHSHSTLLFSSGDRPYSGRSSSLCCSAPLFRSSPLYRSPLHLSTTCVCACACCVHLCTLRYSPLNLPPAITVPWPWLSVLLSSVLRAWSLRLALASPALSIVRVSLARSLAILFSILHAPNTLSLRSVAPQRTRARAIALALECSLVRLHVLSLSRSLSLSLCACRYAHACSQPNLIHRPTAPAHACYHCYC